MLGRPRDDADHPWELEEFTEGWLILEQLEGFGSATKVIEKSTGEVRFFPPTYPLTWSWKSTRRCWTPRM
ncbi:hypothetical protein FAGKG844_250065 [Frankia sp. AgKG'84/4]